MHEGPQGIGQRVGFIDTPMKEGMTVTNGMLGPLTFYALYFLPPVR